MHALRQGVAPRLRELWARPRERGVALALVAAAACALAFGRVVEDYLTNDPLARWDVSFSHWLADRRSTAGLDTFRAIADIGSPAVSAALALVVCVLLYRRHAVADALLVALALAGAEILNVALKLAFHRPRPEVAFVRLDTYSFPSGHAMIATAVYGAFAYLACRRTTTLTRSLVAVGAAAVIVAVIGFSRLYLGVHYLSDVLGGIAAGGTWLALAVALRIAYGDDFRGGAARDAARPRDAPGPSPGTPGRSRS